MINKINKIIENNKDQNQATLIHLVGRYIHISKDMPLNIALKLASVQIKTRPISAVR